MTASNRPASCNRSTSVAATAPSRRERSSTGSRPSSADSPAHNETRGPRLRGDRRLRVPDEPAPDSRCVPSSFPLVAPETGRHAVIRGGRRRTQQGAEKDDRRFRRVTLPARLKVSDNRKAATFFMWVRQRRKGSTNPRSRSIRKQRSTIQFVDKTPAPPLLPIFRSRQQVELLALLLGNPALELSLSELAERLGTPYPSVHREIDRAEAAGLVTSRKVGNTRLVRASTDSPYFGGLSEVLTRASVSPLLLPRRCELWLESRPRSFTVRGPPGMSAASATDRSRTSTCSCSASLIVISSMRPSRRHSRGSADPSRSRFATPTGSPMARAHSTTPS